MTRHLNQKLLKQKKHSLLIRNQRNTSRRVSMQFKESNVVNTKKFFSLTPSVLSRIGCLWFKVYKYSLNQTKGSQYHVKISTTVACTCFDFKMKKKPCKHIYFIVTQVAQNEQILDYFRSTVAKISKAAYGVLDSQLAERLKARLEAGSKGKDAKDIDLKDDTDCTICFTEMDKENEKLEDCSTCKKYFHVICIEAWKNHNPTCPLCRGALAPSV